MSEPREDDEVGVEAAGPSPHVCPHGWRPTECPVCEQWREENGGE